MVRYYLLTTLLIATAVLTGCASPPPDTAWPQPRALRGNFAAYELPAEVQDATSGKPVIDGPNGELTLDQALALALMNNSGLAAFGWERRSAAARALQSRILPNPELELEVEEYDRDGEGFTSSAMALVLGQRFELGGKRRWRSGMAEAEGELAGWDYESKRLDVLTSTVRRFVAVISARHRLELERSAVELAEKTSHAVGERVKAGKEPPLQASKADAELEMARLGALEARSGLDVSRRKLAAMWGSEQPRFGTVQGNLDTVIEAIPPLEALRLRLSANPDLARWDAELRLRMAALSSEKAARVPDLETSLGLQRFEEDGTDSLIFGIGVSLPLFDRNQGNIAAARHDLAKAEAERKAAEMTLAAELVEAHAGFTLSHRRVLTLRSMVVPAMEEAFAAAHEGYRQGKFGFLDMLDAQRGLFEARVALVDALSDYHAALAEIQRITGTGIDELTNRK